ncbi:MAG: ATP-dependent zinc metalloprotease FtsH [Ruminococcaceae bacterium]|nr:ATP-dependent zinc metalloprotease FtsH [Oscillospiraceae bacterium]
MVIILLISFFSVKSNEKKLTYYDVVQMFTNNEVEEYTLNLGSGVLEYKKRDETEKKKYTVPNISLFNQDIHEFVMEYNETHDDDIRHNYKAGNSNSWLVSLLPSVLLLVALGAVMYYMMRKMSQSFMSENNRTMAFGKARIKMSKDDNRRTTFEDVAGADEEKAELAEIVDFLKSPQKYNELGARIPKGVLLVGPPGTGKTLLARAVAGEANAPFLSISGSDFLEMYVGVGASRVRDLFEQAKKNAPAIIFIDEIDAVGRHRGAGMGGGHDEREQTLNQMLVEMDGFVGNESVIVLAATNRLDILDPALLRPGRFDRQITMGYPDIKGRWDILKVHAKNKPLGPDIDLEKIAKSTVGFTGADLENLLNEAALLAARKGLKAITMADVDAATIKTVVGTEKKSHKISEEDKKLTAYHEAGHAVSAHFLGGQDPVHQVSVIPTGMAGGFTMHRPVEDKMYNSKKRMEDNIVTLLGGRVAEKIIIGDISTGASNDIQRVTEIARNMVTKYGMSENLGPITFGSGETEVFLGKDYNTVRNYSEEIAKDIDEEIRKIVTAGYKRCENILTEHIDKLHLLAEYLIRNEKIDGDGFLKLMNGEEVEDICLNENDSDELAASEIASESDETTPENTDSITTDA